MANNFGQREPWMMKSTEKRVEELLADQIMGDNGDRAMSLLSKFALEDMSFRRFEHQLRRDEEKDHLERIAKIREERERRNREEEEARKKNNELNK
ncbi:hypothetical protein PRIPAC_98085 [Pristionchus pacificus]|uniref:Uncharacterized protein n=1 Tax=Pristionchus pacificus TaxID=54126 RepID=A0A2A6BK47_PRIPA|nr:hypothetical protein PRIPAC_98085 [Pristionchus pacificus]|eukprot:PDM66196.1 hypothetical protein PRIPAC_45421 [Pristionchus pacificus]